MTYKYYDADGVRLRVDGSQASFCANFTPSNGIKIFINCDEFYELAEICLDAEQAGIIGVKLIEWAQREIAMNEFIRNNGKIK